MSDTFSTWDDAIEGEPEPLGGEAGGETDTEPGSAFFVSKKAAAVLKHGVLEQYLVPFAAKIGSHAEGHRVVYLDGYAGPGRYADGTQGSPALVLEQASTVSGYRTMECLFVERKRADFLRLQSLVGEAQQAGIHCEAYPGDIQRQLGNVLARAGTAPLFAFLDPYGLGLPFDRLVGEVLGGPRDHRAGVKTEVLLNFSANATRRIGGFLSEDCKAKNREATLRSMDRVCGGDWWRDTYQRLDTNAERVEAIANEYAHRVGRTARATSWSFPVRNRATNQPVYHLVFFTRHPEGMWLFGDGLARAQKSWRRVLDAPPGHDDGTLFDLPDTFDAEEKVRTEEWRRELKTNIMAIRERAGPFNLTDHYPEVFGAALGLARNSLLRQAVKELHQEGNTGCPGTGRISKIRIT